MKTRIIPVIHYEHDEQALRNANRVADAGCHGVFLIDMRGDNRRLVPMAQEIGKRHPRLAIGINHLGTDPLTSLRLNMEAGIGMTWTDAQPTHSEAHDEALQRELVDAIGASGHELFVGVAFKHQLHEPDPVGAARRAVDLGFIPTTSGPATGIAADATGIAALRAGLDEGSPLAIASGISPDNHAAFAPHLTHVLVATGVSKTFHELDPSLLRRLMHENA